jgi:hypothetical protein
MRINTFRGDTLTLNFSVTRSGAAVNLTGATAWFTLKTMLTDADPGVAQATNGSGVTITTPLSGQLTVELPASVTIDIPPGEYQWDLQVKEASGRISTAASGQAYVEADVTRAT